MKELDYHDLFRLNEILLDGSKENTGCVNSFSMNVINSYDIKEVKEKVSEYFRILNDVKYLIDSDVDSLKATIFCDDKVSESQTRHQDVVLDAVVKREDMLRWSSDMVQASISLSKKLNQKEAIYIVAYFINHLSEEEVSEELCMTRKTLQILKKSALIKTYIEFKKVRDMSCTF